MPRRLEIGGLYRDPTGIWRHADTDRPARVWLQFFGSRARLDGRPRRLNVLDPSPFDFEDEDIALGLSREPRWGGQTAGDWAYSVAQHLEQGHVLLEPALQAAITAKKIPRADARRVRLAWHLHDGAEGLGLKDQLGPIKPILGPAWARVVDSVQQVIHVRFGLPGDLPVAWAKLIKTVDRQINASEALQLAGYSEAEIKSRDVLANKETPRTADILDLTPWPPSVAQERWLATLRKLVG
ncbi:hydrolase [Roseiterribacter gracilis]|uniref:Phosphohydrolase n=1 Tax=Roseiterribacter gracilis TaxID=2812848 RepID=A0A8S8X6M1_9PROT|nr:phosphohydrolase [Rhodospirillales bacterium TMPK1]